MPRCRWSDFADARVQRLRAIAVVAGIVVAVVHLLQGVLGLSACDLCFEYVLHWEGGGVTTSLSWLRRLPGGRNRLT